MIKFFSTSRTASAFALGGAVILFAGFGCKSGPSAVSPAPAPTSGTAAEVVPPRTAPTEDEYQKNVRAALAAYLAARTTLPAELSLARGQAELGPVRETREKLSRAVVPAKYREEHLALFLALNQIERGIGDKNNELWKSGEAGLDKLLKTQTWLGLSK